MTARTSLRLQYALMALLTLFVLFQVHQTWKDSPDPQQRSGNVTRDFKTFYCAGATANAHGDPYRTASFDRCGAPAGAPLPSFVRAGVWPAPLPPYDVALFRLFAHLPYRAAAYLWTLLCVVALTIAVVALRQLSGLPPLVIFAALALPDYYESLQWGQLAPIVIGLLAVAAYALRREAYVVAGVACAATLIEPHLGVPICLGVFLWSPGARAAVAIGVAVVACIDAVAAAPSINIEFFRSELPLQALAEVPAENQLSLTWVAYMFGASERVAIQIGSASYAVMTAIGIIVARYISRATHAPEWLPLVPAAAVVLGGPFIHDTQTSVALVAGLLLLGSVRRRTPWMIAGVLLQVPFWYIETWQAHPYSLSRVESVVAVAFIAAAVVPATTSRRIATGALAAGAYLAITYAILHAPRYPLRVPISGTAYAEQLDGDRAFTAGAWGIVVRDDSVNRTQTTEAFEEKLPIWLGLFLVVTTIALAARARNGAPGSRLDTTLVAGQP